MYDYTESHNYYYGYDDKKGAMYHCKTPKWGLILHLNDFGVESNITEQWYTRYNAKYTYEFDGARLPARRTHKSVSGMMGSIWEWVEEYTYIRK
jgi:formylglycine-generating enzyme required for sulfatase activity